MSLGRLVLEMDNLHEIDFLTDLVFRDSLSVQLNVIVNAQDSVISC
jgi:hypothetical protein